MKFSTNLSLCCALLGAVAASGAPQLSLAQEQPRRAESALNPDAKIVLPAQFDATQFFDALARDTNTRIVAPVIDEKQLAELNQKLSGQSLSFTEILPIYEEILGYRFSVSQFNNDLIKVRLPDETIYPTFSIDENQAAYLRLLVAFSPAQIDQMFLQGGFTPADLTPAQVPLYLEARRKNANVTFTMDGEQNFTDAELLAQKVRLRFAFQAVALFTDDESLPSLPLFDYGTGLIWDPLVGADTKMLEKTAYEQDAATLTGQSGTSSNSSEKARATTLDYLQTRATTVGAALDTIEAKLGQSVVLEGDLAPRKVRAIKIVISVGRYRADELLDALAGSIGAQSVFLNDVPTWKKREPQQPISQLPPLVTEAQTKLRRLPIGNSGLPFTQDRFEGKRASYSELNGSERFYLRAKLLNENTEGYDEIDLSKHKFRFVNQLLLIGQTGDIDTPFVTSSLQLW